MNSAECRFVRNGIARQERFNKHTGRQHVFLFGN
jgi:hypothetical protein